MIDSGLGSLLTYTNTGGISGYGGSGSLIGGLGQAGSGPSIRGNVGGSGAVFGTPTVLLNSARLRDFNSSGISPGTAAWDSSGLGGLAGGSLSNIGGVLGVPTGSQFAGGGADSVVVPQGAIFSDVDFSQGPQVDDFDEDGDGKLNDEERALFQQAMSVFMRQNKEQPIVEDTSEPAPEEDPKPEKEPDEDEPSFLQRLREWYERKFGGRSIQIGGYPGGLGGINIPLPGGGRDGGFPFPIPIPPIFGGGGGSGGAMVGKTQSQLRL